MRLALNLLTGTFVAVAILQSSWACDHANAGSQDIPNIELGDPIDPQNFLSSTASSNVKHGIAESPVESLTRTWRLSMADGSQACDIELFSIPDFGPTSVFAGSDCPEGFFNVVGWTIEGDELRFWSPTGRILARLPRSAPPRLFGERDNDGAPLVMTRLARPTGF
jgi:hypothetical protein